MTMRAIKWLGGLLLLVASSAWSASEWQSLTAAQRDVLAPLAERWDQMPDEERERFRDLRRGWRYNNPNLDQLGLLTIRYRGLDEFCTDTGAFAKNKVLAKLNGSGRMGTVAARKASES